MFIYPNWLCKHNEFSYKICDVVTNLSMNISEIIKLEWWKENLEGFIVGILAGIIATIIVMIFIKIGSSIFSQFVKPEIEINFTENEGELVIELQNKGKRKVGKLFYKINIPGEFESYDSKKNLISQISLNNEMLTKHANIMTSETLKIELSEMMPEGWCRIKINYKPNSQNTDLDFPPPFLDLHAVTKIYYFWEYNGEEIYDKKYVELYDLQYIQDDIQGLCDSPLFEKMKEVKKMNWKRRDW